MSTQPLDYVEPDRQARKISVLPPVAFGYVFVPIVWIASFIDLENNPDVVFGLYTGIASLVGAVFWFTCVHRLHVILNEISEGSYNIKPGRAVGFHFVPFFNIFWLFKWPSEFSKYIRANSTVKMLPGGVLGLLFLVSTLMKYVDGGVSLALILGFGVYLRRKLQRYLEEIGYLIRKEPVESGKSKSGWKKMLQVMGGFVGLIVVFVFFVGFMTETGRMPDSAVVAAGNIHPRHLQELRDMGVVTEGERVQFFYSGGFFSIRGSGNLFTDERVVTYMQSGGGLEIIAASYDEVASIDLFPMPDGTDEAIIEVTLEDDSLFHLIVSTNGNGHERFHDRLVRIWEKKH